ncbi:MAG: cardiolipin synthase [Phycisphaerales bacterium]|nr:cardiolipin synthase [Phycisphaerales bacterium]
MSVTWAIFAIDLGVRLLLCVRVILRRAPVTTSLAWLVVILFVPLLGLPLYLLVGEVRLGDRRRRRYERFARRMGRQVAMFWRDGTEDWTSEFGPYAHIARLGTNHSGIPPLRGNTLTLFSDCDQVLASMVKDIDAARRSCHLLFYIWMPTGAGELVGGAMIRAVERGLDCRVLVDGVGSKPFLRSPLCRKMVAAGVQVEVALPANPLRMVFERLDLRNHRKIAVIDGWVGYAGSQNVTDRTFGPKRPHGVGPWVDAMVRIEGPASQALEVVFLGDWQMDTEEEEDLRPTRFLVDAPTPTGGSVVQVVPTGPGLTPRAMMEALLTTLYSAREELIITTPYFVPDDAMKLALMSAAARGVAVTIVMPARIDAPIVAMAARASYEELMEAGVRIVEFQAGLLHSKTITVDRDLALIGSANLDIRSFWLNFEVTVFIFDTDVASQLRMLQVEYIRKSSEVVLATWRMRPFLRRLSENAARLLSPLL